MLGIKGLIKITKVVEIFLKECLAKKQGPDKVKKGHNKEPEKR